VDDSADPAQGTSVQVDGASLAPRPAGGQRQADFLRASRQKVVSLEDRHEDVGDSGQVLDSTDVSRSHAHLEAARPVQGASQEVVGEVLVHRLKKEPILAGTGRVGRTLGDQAVGGPPVARQDPSGTPQHAKFLAVERCARSGVRHP